MSRWFGRLAGGAPLLPLMVLAGLQLMDQADQSAFNVLIPNVRDAFHLSDAGILAVVAVAGACALVGTVPIAFMADRWPRLPIALVGAVVWSAFSVGLGLAASSVVLTVFLAATTMGQAVVFPTHNSLLADSYPVAARPAVYSVHRAGLALGAVVGVLAGAGLAVVSSWRVPFFVFPVPTLAIVAVGLRLREPARGVYEQASFAGVAVPAAGDGEPEPPPSVGEAWRIVWKIGVLRRIFLALPFLAAAVVGFTSLASLQYQRTFHLGTVQRAMLVAPVQIFDVAGVIVGATVATRLARRSLGSVFGLLGVASVTAACFAVLFALAPNVPLAFVGQAGIDASLAVVGPGVLAALSLAIPGRARSLGFSLGALFVLPGLAVIPLVGAVGDAVGLRYGMLLLVPVFAVGGLVVSSAGKVISADVTDVWTSWRARQEMREARRRGDLPLLAVRGLRVGYGGDPVVDGLDLDVAEGEVVALLGTNGAGKSTVLRAIGGATEADRGAVIFDGRDITHMPPDEVARLGVAQVPGGHGIFPSLTVAENLAVAAWSERRGGDADGATARVLERFPALVSHLTRRAGDLSGGQQQMLALAMAFRSRATLLLVDELSLGLAPLVVAELLPLVRELASAGTAVVLVEQSVNVALAVAGRAYVMDKGAVVYAGPADELRRRPDILRSVYLHAAAGSPPPAGSEPGGASLEVREASVRFGGVAALEAVSVAVTPGEIVGIIGPNGAGKTTLLDVIGGDCRPDAGTVVLDGRDVTGLAPAGRARRGLGRCRQGSPLFPGLTVRDTLALAHHRFVDVGDPFAAGLRLPDVVLTEAALAERVDELLGRFGLEVHAERLATELSTGSRRLVELACVVAHRPRLVLLDEPTAGVAQREVEHLAEVLLAVRAELAATLVVVEHDVSFVAGLCSRLVALEEGRVLVSGAPRMVLDDDRVMRAFLGAGTEAVARSGPLPAGAAER